VRVVLFALKKEKLGMEGKCYDNLDQIHDAFKQEMVNKTFTGLSSSSGDSQPSSQSEVLSIKDTSSPAWIASQKGFLVGKMFYFNLKFPDPCEEHEKVVCSITLLADDFVHVKEVSPFTQKPQEHLVLYSNLDALSKFTGQPALALPDGISDHFPAKMESFAREASKAELFSKMAYSCIGASDVCSGLKFIINPYQLVATRLFKKGELKLPLATDQMSKIQPHAFNNAVEVSVAANDVWFVGPPVMPKNEKLESIGKSTVIIPFWFVPFAAEDEDINMEYKSASMELVNTKQVKVGDRLRQKPREQQAVDNKKRKRSS
jgi:hypothetical protein